MGDWRTIRDALATKLNASSGMATAGLRRASAEVDAPLAMLPEARVLQPSYTFLNGSGLTEDYLLDFPVELVCARPGGRKRSNEVALDIVRAAQVEFRTSVKLGVNISNLSVIDCRLVGAQVGLDVYSVDVGLDGLPAYDGYTLQFQVQVRESITRTA